MDNANHNRNPEFMINWFVYRHPDFANEIAELGRSSAGIQKVVHDNANLLIRDLQQHGPNQHNRWRNYRYDAKNDMHHCHVTMMTNSYDVTWEADPAQRFIQVLWIGTRENFDFTRKTNKATSIQNGLRGFFSEQHYDRIFTVPNMPVGNELRRIYANYFPAQQLQQQPAANNDNVNRNRPRRR